MQDTKLKLFCGKLRYFKIPKRDKFISATNTPRDEFPRKWLREMLHIITKDWETSAHLNQRIKIKKDTVHITEKYLSEKQF